MGSEWRSLKGDLRWLLAESIRRVFLWDCYPVCLVPGEPGTAKDWVSRWWGCLPTRNLGWRRSLGLFDSTLERGSGVDTHSPGLPWMQSWGIRGPEVPLGCYSLRRPISLFSVVVLCYYLFKKEKKKKKSPSVQSSILSNHTVLTSSQRESHSFHVFLVTSVSNVLKVPGRYIIFVLKDFST